MAYKTAEKLDVTVFNLMKLATSYYTYITVKNFYNAIKFTGISDSVSGGITNSGGITKSRLINTGGF